MKPKAPLSLVYKLQDLDMGIALCHYALACKMEDKTFSFTRQTALPQKQGFNPFGLIKSA